MSSSTTMPGPMDPLAPPPLGVTPNFVNPETRVPGALAAIIVIVTFSTVVFFMRLYARLFVAKLFGVEDWFALAAFVVTAGLSGLFIAILTGGGYGPHIWNVTYSVYTPAFFSRSVATEVVYPTSAWLIKMTIFFLYFRIFKIKTFGRWFIIGGIVVVSLFWLIQVTIIAVWCVPLPGQTSMMKLMSNGCAKKSTKLITALGAFNLIADVYLLSIVIPLIWGLQVNTARKVGISIVVLTGLLATICSALRVWQSTVALKTTDPTWDEVIELVVTVYETNVGLICACLPTLPILFQSKHLGSWGITFRSWVASHLTSRSNSNSTYSHSGAVPKGSEAYKSQFQNKFERVASDTELGDIRNGSAV